MNEENTPQRPGGLDGPGQIPGAPRVEVEPTPQPRDDDHAASAQDAAQTTSIPGQADAPGATQAGPARPQGAPGGASSESPAGPIDVSTRTVVKTRAKKIPVFLASLGGLVVGAVLVVALMMTGAFRITDKNVEATSPSTQSIEIDSEDTTLAEAVAAKSLPSVVSITTQTSSGGGIGSGVILDTDGNILTNQHVIADATSIVVSTEDGSYEAELVGADESSDLAVVRLTDASKASLTPIEIGDSDSLEVGEWVMAIGSPFGNEQSVSTGIVSALYRSTALPSTSGSTIYANMIQTDAAINPGNSGGALVNDNGELIGINSIIESYSGSSSGVGFAIPSNYAVDIANQIIAGETPAHPYLGVTVTSVNAYNAHENNLPVNEGAYVVSVNGGTPAEEAGLKKGDIVTAIDDDAVTSADNLIISLREHKIGDTVTLTVVRDGDEQEIKVKLGSDADLQEEEQDNTQGNGSGNSMSEEDFLRYLEEFLGSRSLGGQIG